MDRAAIHQYIDAHLDEHIEHIRRWVRQPSVSWDNHGVDACARVVADAYRALGCREVEIIEGRYHPGVWAVYDAGAAVTFHNYCMFDTRTVTPAGWDFDPFGAELTPLGPYPKVVVGRGAMFAKGPYVAFLNALEAIVAVEGRLPVNILFLAEGDEIMGSPSYRDYVGRYRDQLRHARASYCATSTQQADGAVEVGLGLKGMVVVELTASGAAWGHGPAATIHSSAGALVASPPFRLAQALATLTEPDGRGCAVDGLRELWTYRKPLSMEERALLDALAARFAGRDWRDVLPLGGAGNVATLESDDPLVDFLYGPTFNIAGLRGGFLGPGTATIPFIVPGTAMATLDLRWVVPLDPEEIINRLRGHLDARGFGDIGLHVYSAFSHATTAPNDPGVRATLETLRAWGAEPVVWPIQPGGGPWTVVPNAFDVPCIRGGALGAGGGATNEYFVIEGDGQVAGLADVEKYHVDLLYAVAHAYGADA